jgi:predicted RNA-binding protein YlqC (UPF0109 family)
MSELITEATPLELITAIARALVDKPGGVSVEETSNEFGETLHLRVDPTDVGLVIGNQGRTARSLRTLLGAISVKLHHRYSLEIVQVFDQGSKEK